MTGRRLAIVLFCIVVVTTVRSVNAQPDLQLKSFTITEPRVVNYPIGHDVLFNATVDVRNIGDSDISGGDDDHFRIKLYFIDNMNWNQATRISPETGMMVEVDDSDEDKMSGEFPGSTATPPSPVRAIGFAANVSMPEANCTKYSHLCAVMNITDDSIDSDAGNDFQCLALRAQPPLGAGFRDCRVSSSGLITSSTLLLVSSLLLTSSLFMSLP
ncbi:uncharacterized protein [Ptychodera flava]|uniref:uncharacterized protein n=1 Tax=Ptychodera flava TaxID=63121 RepID=UPI003969FA37